ncbi:MAG: AmmeMemoRadiSam system protein A [Acidobacteriaceae bacterium]|nr:AmmeMemoRadiSam system protein A [Acidobacteriaceae bacterium]
MSLQPENSSAGVATRARPAGAPEFDSEERRILLQLAHNAIESVFDQREINVGPPSSHFSEPRGAFTTIYLHGQLRGCVGYVFAVTPLYRTVAETARAAAFEDTRFYPITREEAPDLRVSLSILSNLEEIKSDQIEVGRHGLVISLHGQRGLLLPQVPVEYQWTRTTFLEQTCRKAGLPTDAWKTGARLEAFTAEVFGDDDLK